MDGVIAYLAAARQQEADELEKLARTCELVLCANELVHCLQQERGATNLYLASRGTRFADLRRQRCAASDQARAAVVAWLQPAAGLSGGARLYTRIALALHALASLPALRDAAGGLAETPASASERFNHLIATLLALVFEAADVAVDPAISRLLIALFHLMQGKEYAGQERATGAAAFAAGAISGEQVQTIDYLIEMQEQSLQHFAAFADVLRAEWQALQTLLPLPELDRMRRRLLGAVGRPLASTEADAWFACCSQRMDEFHRVEVHVAELLQQLCRDKVAELRRELADQESLFARLHEVEALPPFAVFASGGQAQLAPGQVGPHLTQSVFDLLQAQSRRLHSVTEELAAVRTALEERKLIERAKGILMAHQGLGEEAAYRLLRQNAMNQKRRLADVAQAVLSLAEMLPGSKSARPPGAP